MFKCKLHELCQKRGFASPEYSYIKYGQDHNSLYKARVIVNDSTFKSSSAFRNHKSADNDVAEIAFSHFVTFSRALNETTQAHSLLHLFCKTRTQKLHLWIHSLPSTSEADCIKSVINDPNPIKSTDTHLLCNNIRVYTRIRDKMLTEGGVVLPIGYGKWTIVSLEHSWKSPK